MKTLVRLAIGVSALVGLSGCVAQFDVAGTDWTKSEATIQQLTLDEMECARGSESAGQWPDLIVGGLVDVVRIGIQEGARTRTFNGCMAAKGYARRS